jgi:hypothetical protein
MNPVTRDDWIKVMMKRTLAERRSSLAKTLGSVVDGSVKKREW